MGRRLRVAGYVDRRSIPTLTDILARLAMQVMPLRVSIATSQGSVNDAHSDSADNWVAQSSNAISVDTLQVDKAQDPAFDQHDPNSKLWLTATLSRSGSRCVSDLRHSSDS